MSLREQIRAACAITSSVWRDESNRDQRLRRLFMATGWQVRKRVVRKPVDLELFNGVRFRAYPDCSCSSSAIYYKVPNAQSIGFLRNHARHGTFVDVGANVGLMSMLMADSVHHALLFEPNPVAAARARENVKLNGLSFEVHELALSDQTAPVGFEDLGGVNPCNRTLDPAANSQNDSPIRTVPGDSLDHFLSRRAPFDKPVTVVKIDVEGHENWVLRGMKQLLLTHRPAVVFEYLQRTNLKDTFAIFSGVDYRAMALSPEGQLTPARLDTRPLQDLFAIPCESEYTSGTSPVMRSEEP